MTMETEVTTTTPSPVSFKGAFRFYLFMFCFCHQTRATFHQINSDVSETAQRFYSGNNFGMTTILGAICDKHKSYPNEGN